jgi:hypothetical protein
MGNCHARFLGEGREAIPEPYPLFGIATDISGETRLLLSLREAISINVQKNED